MFYWTGFAIGAATAIAQAGVERKAMEEKWAAMPPDEAAKDKAAYQARIEEDLRHRRALEVAEAGRSRNWLETLFG